MRGMVKIGMVKIGGWSCEASMHQIGGWPWRVVMEGGRGGRPQQGECKYRQVSSRSIVKHRHERVPPREHHGLFLFPSQPSALTLTPSLNLSLTT